MECGKRRGIVLGGHFLRQAGESIHLEGALTVPLDQEFHQVGLQPISMIVVVAHDRHVDIYFQLGLANSIGLV